MKSDLRYILFSNLAHYNTIKVLYNVSNYSRSMYCSVVLCTHLAVGQNNFLHYAHLFDHHQWALRSNKIFDEFVKHELEETGLIVNSNKIGKLQDKSS